MSVKKSVNPNFLECVSVADANKVDLSEYRLVNYSDRRGVYVFTRRSNRVGL